MQELLELLKSETSQSQPVDSSPIWHAVNRVKCGTLSSAEFFDPTGCACRHQEKRKQAENVLHVLCHFAFRVVCHGEIAKK